MLNVVLVLLLFVSAPGEDSGGGRKADPGGDPGMAELKLAKGQISFQKGDYKEAVRYMDQALELDDENGEALYWRGLAHLWLKNYQKAENDLMAASSERSEDVSLRMALGRAQLAQGKFMWAMRQFGFVTEQQPENIEALLDLGYCLMRIDAYDDAKEVLGRALKAAPKGDMRTRAKLLLGVCHYRGKNLPRARGLLLDVRRGNWRRGARVVLDRILESESGIEKGWRAYFTAGAGVDSNPVMGDEPIPGLSRSEDAALDFMLGAGLGWTPFVKGAHSLSGRIDLGRHFYVAPWDLSGAHERVSAFSMTTLAAGGDYTFAYLKKKGPRKLSVGYLFRLVQLDGGDGLPGEEKPFIFSESHGLSLSWSLQNHVNRTFELQLQPSYSAYRDRDRDGAGVVGKARWSLFFLDKKLKLFPELSLSYDDARFEGWKNISAGGWVGVSYLGPWKLDFTGSLSQEARIHPESKDAFGVGANPWQLDPGEMRHDHVTAAAIGVGRPLDKKGTWRMDLSTRYMRSWSTAKFFKYSRLTAMLSVTAVIGDES